MKYLNKSNGKLLFNSNKPIIYRKNKITVTGGGSSQIYYYDDNGIYQTGNLTPGQSLYLYNQLIYLQAGTCELHITGECIALDGFGMHSNILYVYGDITINIQVCCFVPSTLITMADRTTKKIIDIKIGDKILTYNSNMNAISTTEVTNIVINQYSINMAKVEFENGSIIEMTDYHPILTMNGWHSITNYNNYDTLKVGDVCITQDGTSIVKNIIVYKNNTPIDTYTLDVTDTGKDLDNFFANGICAHNAC